MRGTPDPASLNVDVRFTGLSNKEAAAVFDNLPAGSTSAVSVTQPVIGPKRFEIHAQQLSLVGAKDLVTAALAYVESVANQG